MKKFILLLLVSPLFILTQGCNSGGSSQVADNPEYGPVNNFDVNKYALNKLVCDPLDQGPSPGPNDGLIASLHYRKAGQERFYDVMSYIELGQKSSQTLFFTTLNVPTRLFQLGFPTETGASVENDNGEVLNEYFALKLNSILKLAPDDEGGTYELALLSDDGALFKIRDNDGVYQVVVDNDGDHPTRLGCGQTIDMHRESELAVEIDYYQGPRYHISLIPMWRKVTASTQPEPLCGKLGNSLYFDYNNNSQPQSAYNALLSRGWKPIAAANWHLPAFADFNPCTEGDPPQIINLQYEMVEGFITFTWETDKPATSQILYSIAGNNEQNMTEADNRLRMVHQVTIAPGTLQGGTEYEFQAVSISDTFGKGMSDILNVVYQY